MFRVFLTLSIGMSGLVLSYAQTINESPTNPAHEKETASQENQESDLMKVLMMGFPVIDISTVDSEVPTVDYVSPPPGSMGYGTINATKVPGKVERYESNGELSYSSGDYVKSESGMTIKIRGNSSAYQDQKPYKIKLQKKADLLNRGDKIYADKNWALIADVGWWEWIGRNIAQKIQHQWSPECEYVNVVFNGKYHGLYLLTETIERNEKARINVTETGYIAEKDPYWWTEEDYIPSSWHPAYNYTLKYPDLEDLDTEDRERIATELDHLREITKQPGYAQVIELDSWIDFVLTHDFVGTKDSGGCNIYYTKKDSEADTKIGLGPAWDFDSATNSLDFSSTHLWEANLVNLFENEDKAFVGRYLERYDAIAEEVWTAMEAMLIEGPCDEDKLQCALEATEGVVNHRMYTHTQAEEIYDTWFWNHKDQLQGAIDALRLTTSQEEIIAPKHSIHICEGQLHIAGLNPKQWVRVFSSDGYLLKEKVTEGEHEVTLDLNAYTGMIICRIDDKSFKLWTTGR